MAPADVNPTWAPPTGQPAASNRKTIPAWLLYGSLLLALVLLIVGIWAFGGFKRRTDLFKTTPPGTLFTTGPYEFRFTEATAQHKNDFGSTPYWEMVVIGEGRTTGKESISPDTMGDSGMFASNDDVGQEVELPQSTRMGRGQGFDRYRFTPGLPLIPYSVVFKYKDRYRPGPTIRFAVFDLVYGKHYLASEEEGWHNGLMRGSSICQYASCLKRCIDSGSPRHSSGGLITGVRAAEESSVSAMPTSWSA